MTYRSARDGDEDAILGLFHQVFGLERSQRRWRWQYGEGAGGPGVVTVAVHDGAVVGCVTLMRQDLNYAGARVPAAQGCDAMLATEMRGGGRFRDLAGANYEAGAEAGIDAMVAFPNANSFAPSVRGLGHQRIVVLHHFYRRVGIRRAAGYLADRVVRRAWALGNRTALAVLRRRSRSHLSIDTTTTLPSDLEPLLDAWRRAQVLSFWKDDGYLRWRYEDHPDHRYSFHVLRADGAARGLAVTRRTDGAVAICELLVHPGSTREAAVLIREIVRQSGRDPSCQLVEFYGADAGFYQAAFAEAGFRGSPYSPLVMTGRPLRSHEVSSLLPMPGNWTVSYGDTDVA